MPCRLVGGSLCFGGTYRFHLQGRQLWQFLLQKMEVIRSSETLVSTFKTTRHHNPEDNTNFHYRCWFENMALFANGVCISWNLQFGMFSNVQYLMRIVPQSWWMACCPVGRSQDKVLLAFYSSILHLNPWSDLLLLHILCPAAWLSLVRLPWVAV
jgi:hypothetical protein